jgi:hypothetical protein
MRAEAGEVIVEKRDVKGYNGVRLGTLLREAGIELT